jgi:transglutaminase-like putative cysteine protease
MWPWLIAGVVIIWLLRGSLTTVGQTDVPQLPGAAGIVQTMGLMRSLTNSAIAHPLIRQHAARATEHVARGNQKDAALAIGEWVRAKVRYVPDPLHNEHLTSPIVMAQAIADGKKVFGDCDDMSMLVAAMAKSIGMQPTFHGVGRKDRFHHVYTEVAGVPIDPTVSMGTKPFDAQRRISVTV